MQTGRWIKLRIGCKQKDSCCKFTEEKNSI
jgi:hypothetical protein